MPFPLRHKLLLTLPLALSLGCQLPGLTPPTGKRPAMRRDAGDARTAIQAIREPIRPIDLSANELISKTRLIGKVKLLSDKGLGLISNNGGGLVSNNGGGLVSDKGLGIVSSGGGSFRALAGEARPETLLADAVIEVLDAEGNLLADASGEPITTTSDKTGAYRFEASLPRENLILRVNLFNGGQLMAFLLPHETETKLDIDTASTLGAAYVLDKYVRGVQSVLNRLPAEEAAALQTAFEASLGLLGEQLPSYRREAMVAAAEAVRQEAQTVDETLERIEAVLLAGQEDLGNGRLATEVALLSPSAVISDGQGGLLLVESTLGRIRRIDADGRISQMAVTGTPGRMDNLVMAPDGSLYVSSRMDQRVYRIATNGTATLVAGGGKTLVNEQAVVATEAKIRYANSLAVGEDGTLYIGEAVHSTAGGRPRVLVLQQGRIRALPTPELFPESKESAVCGMVLAADGALYAGFYARDEGGVIRYDSEGQWSLVTRGVLPWMHSGLAMAPNGSLLMVEDQHSKVRRVWPDGRVEPFAGVGQPGYTGDRGPATAASLSYPRGITQLANGEVLIADAGNGVIRAIDSQGRIRTIAGATGVVSQGDALTVALNGPTGVTLDPSGRIVVSEGGGHTIKRLEDGRLTVVAGTSKGAAGDGGPATAGQLDAPGSIAYRGQELILVDSGNGRIRKVDAEGKLHTLAGERTMWEVIPNQPRYPALSTFMRTPAGLAIAQDGTIYWTDSPLNRIFRLVGDEVEIVLGLDRQAGYEGDGGPASQAKVNRPLGLAFAANGDLYVADAGNMCVRKIGNDGNISRVAGLPLPQALTRIFSYKPEADEGKPALEALILGPTAMVFDAAGQLYLAEAGTTNVSQFAGELPIPVDALPKVGARIRKIGADGTIVTVAGHGTRNMADLGVVASLAFDRDGNLLVVDASNNQLKALPKSAL